MRPILLAAFLAAAAAGCASPTDGTQMQPPEHEASVAPPRDLARLEENGTLRVQQTMPPYDPAGGTGYSLGFDPLYTHAEAVLTWTAASPPGERLALLLLDAKGAGGTGEVLASVEGTSPLRLRVAPADVGPGLRDFVVHVPRGAAPLLADQPFWLQAVVVEDQSERKE